MENLYITDPLKVNIYDILQKLRHSRENVTTMRTQMENSYDIEKIQF